MAWHLLQLARISPPYPVAEVAIRHADLAAIVGTAREVVSRALSSFREEGIVRTRRSSIVIDDRERLMAVARSARQRRLPSNI